MPFLDRLQHWAAVRPQAPAVVMAEGRLGYAGLRDQAAATARRAQPLRAALPEARRTFPKASADPAVAGGMLTAICLPNSLAFVREFCAAVTQDNVAAVLDPAWTAAQRAAVLERLQPDRIVQGGPGYAADVRPDNVRPADVLDGDPQSAFLCGFTSGTTSLPKAFIRSRRSWALSLADAPLFGLRPGVHTLVPGPLSSSLSLYALAESLYGGGTVHLLAEFDPAAAVNTLRTEPVSRLVAVPAILRLLAGRGGRADGAGSNLETIVCGGAKLDGGTIELIRQWAPRARIIEYYGAAELSFIAYRQLEPLGSRAVGPAPGPNARPERGDDPGTAVGTPFPGVEVRITDATGRPVREGTVGTIEVRSGLVSDGYLWGDDGTAFTRDGDRCTVGDQGYLSGGVLHYLGRREDMIVSAGHNVYPQEIEAVLAGLPGVRAAVVGAVPDERRGQRIVAALQCEQGGPSRTEVLAACRERLPGHKVPREFYRLLALPHTAQGKTSRSLLVRWLAGGDDRVRPLP